MISENKAVLGIDTSGKTASCAVVQGGRLLAENTFLTKLTHSQIILPVMKRTLADCGLGLSDVGLYAVSAGPGSYTGLRIGIAAVKGLCFGGTPCIGVSTLEALAYNVLPAKGLILPALAARPGVSYFGGYSSDGLKLTEVFCDRVADESEIKKLVEDYPGDVLLTGDCAERLKSELFADSGRVTAAPLHLRLQSAAGVCMAAIAHISEAGSAERLSARYLQNTMAEKLKDREKANEAKKA